MNKTRAGIALAFVFFGFSFAHAQTSVAESDIQAALRELRSEIAALRGTVSDLQSELASVRAEFQTVRSSGTSGGGTILIQEPPATLQNTREVQTFLRNFPDVYPEGHVTGYYGDLTRQAIRRFQARYGENRDDENVRRFYQLVFGSVPTIPAVVSVPFPPDVPTVPTVATTTTPLPMLPTVCPALPTVTACGPNEDRVVSSASAACGTYYTCVPQGTTIATSTTATSTSSTGGWRRVIWGRGGSSLVGPGVPQTVIDARIASIAVSCPTATYYYYANPSDPTQSDAGVASCPSSTVVSTSTTGVVVGGCSRYGTGWHAMDASGNCFDPAMQNYRTTEGTFIACSTFSVSGCNGATSYAGDANSCPGFAYSNWDTQGRRYCQLNTSLACDYNYPSYLTNGANYTAGNCPLGSTSGGGTAYSFTPQFTEPSGGCGQYGSVTRSMQWVLHSTAIGGSCTSGSRPSNVVTSCPVGQWPMWDSNGWPTGCSGGGWTTPTSTTGTGTGTTGTGTTSGTSGGGSGTSSSTYSGGSGYGGYGTPPAGQQNQVWNSLGLQSWIRTDADSARIDQLKQACTNVQSGANVWMPGAGDPASVDFGMPDAGKCALAAACTSGQYFNGSSCGAGGSSGGYTYTSSSSYSGGSSCSASLTNLLGSGCHYMYSNPSGPAIYCNSGMTLSAKEGDTTTTPGCSAPTSLSAEERAQLGNLLAVVRAALAALLQRAFGQ